MRTPFCLLFRVHSISSRVGFGRGRLRPDYWLEAYSPCRSRSLRACSMLPHLAVPAYRGANRPGGAQERGLASGQCRPKAEKRGEMVVNQVDHQAGLSLNFGGKVQTSFLPEPDHDLLVVMQVALQPFCSQPRLRSRLSQTRVQ